MLFGGAWVGAAGHTDRVVFDLDGLSLAAKATYHGRSGDVPEGDPHRRKRGAPPRRRGVARRPGLGTPGCPAPGRRPPTAGGLVRSVRVPVHDVTCKHGGGPRQPCAS